MKRSRASSVSCGLVGDATGIAGRNCTEEVEAMRTIAIRAEDELHQVLTLLAKLSGRTLVDEIREALDDHIAKRSAEVDLTAQAKVALEEIDKEAADRRKAIESLLAKPAPKAPAKGRGSGKGEEA